MRERKYLDLGKALTTLFVFFKAVKPFVDEVFFFRSWGRCR